MANEATMVASLKFVKDTTDKELSLVKILDVTGTDYNLASQTIGTSEEALALGDVAVGGLVLIINRDSTNYVEIHATGAQSTAMIKINAGEPALYRTSSTAPFATANTSAVIIEILILDT